MLTGRPLPKRSMTQTSRAKVKQKPTNERRHGCMPVHLHLRSPSLSVLPVARHSLRDLLAISAVYRSKQTRGGQGTTAPPLLHNVLIVPPPGLEVGVFD